MQQCEARYTYLLRQSKGKAGRTQRTLTIAGETAALVCVREGKFSCVAVHVSATSTDRGDAEPYNEGGLA